MRPKKAGNILELIGHTPLVRVNRMNPNPDVELYVKLEYQNPGGSVKDRIGAAMIEAAEKDGSLVPGRIVLEASSGNTAIGLAMACAVKGYQLAVTMAESASEERKKILRAYGAQLILTPGHMGTDGAIEEAYRLAREYPDKYVLVDQYNNEANWQAHYKGTGREIFDATDGKVDVVVLTMGTTGTLMGCTRILKELKPGVRVVGVEPYKKHKIQGLKNMKESYPPGIFDPTLPDVIVNIEDEPAYEAARRLAREEGILVGMSAGAAMAVAMEEAARRPSGVVVALLPDSGERYLSTSLFVSKAVPVNIRLFNTLSKKVEELVPVREGRVGIYSCGPSLDGPPDLALCRRLVFGDVLSRYLEFRGFQVQQVMNVADIDDRTIQECLAHGGNIREFTGRWEKSFNEALETLRVRPATHMPRSSEHVADMIEETRLLLEKGLAYEKLRSVYFRIGSFPEYGKLAGIAPSSVAEGKSTEYDYYEKDNPRDFALFKRSTLAELKAGIYWPTPWGSARPGWHVECSTMARRLLGQPFDIHTAATNLIFPHGDNEIAIAEGLTGKPLANLWLHSELVMADGKVVSRRTGNDYLLETVLGAGFTGAEIRFWLLATHYRRVANYSVDELQRAAGAVRRLNDFVLRLRRLDAGQPSDEFSQALYDARTGFREAMDNDLHVPKAIAELFAFVRTANRLGNEGKLGKSQVEQSLEFLQEVDSVLAVIDFAGGSDDPDIQRLVDERNEARKRRDFPMADQLRKQLEDLGVVVVDSPTGTAWHRQ
jgi:cysteinyl-tRNA synthetase